MEAVRTVWSDERLDVLNGKVDGLRADLRTEVGSLREETKALRTETRAEMAALRAEMNELRGEMNARFDSLQRSILAGAVALSGTMVLGFASIIATQL